MARLFVVNATGQKRRVNYRLDFTVDEQGRRTSERMVPPKHIDILPRQQVQFGGDLHVSQVSEIVQQLEHTCGAVHVDAIRTAKRKGAVKMVWSQDKPVTKPILDDLVKHNIKALAEQGAERRKRLAVAANIKMNQIGDRVPSAFEMEFEQTGEFDEGMATTEKLEHGVRVAIPQPR